MYSARRRRFKTAGAVLLILYLSGLTYFLFFSERYGRTLDIEEFRYNLVPFREIKRFLMGGEYLGHDMVMINLVGNVTAFIPFGLLLPWMRRRMRGLFRVLGAMALFSLLIESLQLITRVGSFDVDDIILNTIGGVLGYGLFLLFRRLAVSGDNGGDDRGFMDESDPEIP